MYIIATVSCYKFSLNKEFRLNTKAWFSLYTIYIETTLELHFISVTLYLKN